MRATRLGKMVAGATAAIALSATVASAQAVQYCTVYSYTALSFTSPVPTSACGAAAATRTFGSGANVATLTFTGQALSTVTSPTFADLGQVVVTGSTGTGASVAGTNIFMYILQFNPVNGLASPVGALAGLVDGTTSSGTVTWNPLQVNIDNVRYFLEGSPTGGTGVTPINAQSTGPQTIRGYIQTQPTSVVPEPSSILLLGSGIAGLGLFGVRARRRSSETLA